MRKRERTARLRAIKALLRGDSDTLKGFYGGAAPRVLLAFRQLPGALYEWDGKAYTSEQLDRIALRLGIGSERVIKVDIPEGGLRSDPIE